MPKSLNDHINIMFVKEIMVRTTYADFNARNIEGVLLVLHPDVEWENEMEGGYVHGHEGVCEYWDLQWTLIDTHVEPMAIQIQEDGRVIVKAHQLVRDLEGCTLSDQMIHHIYEFEDDLIKRMTIKRNGSTG